VNHIEFATVTTILVITRIFGLYISIAILWLLSELFEHLLATYCRMMARELVERLMMWCNKITSDSARGKGGLVATPTGRSEKVVGVFVHSVYEVLSAHSKEESIQITQFDLRHRQCVNMDAGMLE
jgi:predicted cation transporter